MYDFVHDYTGSHFFKCLYNMHDYIYMILIHFISYVPMYDCVYDSIKVQGYRPNACLIFLILNSVHSLYVNF